MKKKKLLLVIILILIIIFVVSFVGIENYRKKKNQQEIDASIHGVILADDVPFYAKAETNNVRQIKLLHKGENVYILDEFEKDNIDWYKVKIDGKRNGYVRADSVHYYKEINSQKVLVSDVSQFNINKNFENMEDFEVFLLENEISYVSTKILLKHIFFSKHLYFQKNYVILTISQLKK